MGDKSSSVCKRALLLGRVLAESTPVAVDRKAAAAAAEAVGNKPEVVVEFGVSKREDSGRRADKKCMETEWTEAGSGTDVPEGRRRRAAGPVHLTS